MSDWKIENPLDYDSEDNYFSNETATTILEDAEPLQNRK